MKRIGERKAWRLVAAAMLGGALACAPAARADLSLSEALTQARGDNPEVKALREELDAASWGRLEALATYLPHLSVDGDHYLAQKYANLGIDFAGTDLVFPSAVPTSLFNLNLSVQVFDGFAGIQRYRAARLLHQSSEERLRQAEFSLEREIRIGFYRALAAADLAVVADQNIKTLEDHLGIARTSERSGVATRFDVLRVDAELDEARAAKINAEDNASVALRDLVVTMGLGGDTDQPPAPLPRIAGDLPLPDESAVPADLAFSAESRRDLKAQLLRDEAADLQASAASRFWLPNVTVFGQEQFYRFANVDPPLILPSDGFQNAYSIGLHLSWNIFDGGASLARSNSADSRVRADRERTRAELIRAPADFELWKRRFFYNINLFRARGRTLEESRESVRLATIGLRAGSRTHTEVLDAELDLFRARAGIIEAQLGAVEALNRLELALGRELTGTESVGRQAGGAAPDSNKER